MTAKHRTRSTGTCTHWKYWLKCVEADALHAERGSVCWLCGDRDQVVGYDHDESLGRWAVRGLLCRRCNVHLFNDKVVTAAKRRQYLDDAWWKRTRTEEFVAEAREEQVRRVLAAMDRHASRDYVSLRTGVDRAFIDRLAASST